MKLKAIAVVLTLCAIATPGFAIGRSDSSLMSVSPDSKTLVYKGYNARYFSIADAKTLTRTKNVWVKYQIQKFCFTKDSKKLFLFCQKRKIFSYDFKTGKLSESKIVIGTKYSWGTPFGYSTEANRAIFVDGKTHKEEKETGAGYAIKVLDLSNEKIVKSLPLPKKFKPTVCAISPDGKTVLAVQLEIDGKEKKVSRSKRPKNLKGFDRDIWSQKHDGDSSRAVFIDVETGKIIKDYYSYCSSYACEGNMLWFDGKRGFMNSVNSGPIMNYFIDGTTKLTKRPVIKNSDFAMSNNGKYVFSAGSWNTPFTWGFVKNEKTIFVLRKKDRLPGFSDEEAKYIAVSNDGVGYIITNTSRIIKVKIGEDKYIIKPFM